MFDKRKYGRNSRRKSLWQKVVLCGKDFCLATSIQGFSHIAAPGRHWTERLLWIGVLCASLWAMTELSLGQLQRYQENPTVVTLEKDFRNWNFSLPAVTACHVVAMASDDRVDPTKLEQAIQSRWKVSPDDEKYSYYQRFVTTVANSDLFHLEGYTEFADDETLDVDLKQLVIDVMLEQQVKTSTSLNIIAKWMPVMTEAGVCYVTNSLAIADVALSSKPSRNYSELLPYTCKYSSMSCYIMFEVFNNVDFYVHSPYDVADMTSAPSRTYITLNRFTELGVSETRAGAGVWQLQRRRRRCLYTDEPTDHTRQVYSTNTCRLACRGSLALQLCGCVPFYYFYHAGPHCRVSGMRCLAEHGVRLAAARCVCGQPCVNALFREIATDDQIWGRGPFHNKGSVRFTVQAPRARYTREIVFHFQDLVVSFGGAAGLFMGASFISFVEILFFVLQRCLCCSKVEQKKSKESKKTRISFERTRIENLTSMLEGHRYYKCNTILVHVHGNT